MLLAIPLVKCFVLAIADVKFVLAIPLVRYVVLALTHVDICICYTPYEMLSNCWAASHRLSLWSILYFALAVAHCGFFTLLWLQPLVEGCCFSSCEIASEYKPLSVTLFWLLPLVKCFVFVEMLCFCSCPLWNTFCSGYSPMWKTLFLQLLHVYDSIAANMFSVCMILWPQIELLQGNMTTNRDVKWELFNSPSLDVL